MILDVAFVDSENFNTIYEDCDYGILEIYQNKLWNNEDRCKELAYILYLGNPYDSPRYLGPDLSNNLSNQNFKSIMRDIEKIKKFQQWINT